MTLCYWVTTEMSADCRSCFAVSNKIPFYSFPFLIKQGVDLKCFTKSNRLLFYDQYSEYVSDIDINCRCRDKKVFFLLQELKDGQHSKVKVNFRSYSLKICLKQVLIVERCFFLIYQVALFNHNIFIHYLPNFRLYNKIYNDAGQKEFC